MVKMSVGWEVGQRENGVPPGRSSMKIDCEIDGLLRDATVGIDCCRVDDSDRSPVRYSKENMPNFSLAKYGDRRYEARMERT